MFKMNTFLNRDLLNVLKRRLNAMDKHGMQTGRTLSIACHRPVGQPERASWMKSRFQIYYSDYELLTKFCTYVCKILCLCFLVSIPLSMNACGGQRATLGVMPGTLHIIFISSIKLQNTNSIRLASQQAPVTFVLERHFSSLVL